MPACVRATLRIPERLGGPVMAAERCGRACLRYIHENLKNSSRRVYKPEDADVVFAYDYCYLARCGRCAAMLLPKQRPALAQSGACMGPAAHCPVDGRLRIRAVHSRAPGSTKLWI